MTNGIQKDKDMQEVVSYISAKRSDLFSFKEFMRHKDVFVFLAWRDILVRYKQTLLGIAWVVVRPFVTMMIFTFIFGRLAGFSSHGVPYPLLVFVGLLPWQFFSDGFLYGSGSFLVNVNLISKVYFPRIILPISAIVSFVIDFAISFALLLIIMIYYGVIPVSNVVFIPLFLVWTFMVTTAASLLMGALSVHYRDFKHVMPFLIQLISFLSPVGFSSEVVPLKWRTLYSLNPLVGIIDGFRWALLGESLYIPGQIVSLIATVMLIWIGVFFFKRLEPKFADVI